MDRRARGQQVHVSRALTRVRRRHPAGGLALEHLPKPPRQRSEEPAPENSPGLILARRSSLLLTTEMRQHARTREDVTNWEPSDSWLAMAQDIQLWSEMWRLGPSPHRQGPAVPFDDPSMTSERAWSAPLPMITTTAARAVAAAIAAGESADDTTLETPSDKCWDHVLQVCMDGMRELERRQWLVDLDLQEACLSGKRRRLDSKGDAGRRQHGAAGIGSNEDGWLDYNPSSDNRNRYVEL
ncbi:hypothetical protein FB451DRAFT_1379791 [Mycena latifolia]|nr:hypothetical protein FB451DRAFT_1379791 [Mycena latifolia]